MLSLLDSSHATDDDCDYEIETNSQVGATNFVCTTIETFALNQKRKHNGEWAKM